MSLPKSSGNLRSNNNDETTIDIQPIASFDHGQKEILPDNWVSIDFTIATAKEALCF